MITLQQTPQAVVILGLIFILAEIFLGIEAGFDLIIIGSILVVAGLTGTTFASLPTTLILSIAMVLIYMILGRKIIKNKLSTHHVRTNTDNLIGSQAIVIKAIKPHHPGQVKVHDEIWRASSDTSLPQNSQVTIVRINGITLEVEALKQE